MAGLSFALEAAKHGRVTIVTKKASAESATNYAQGGIAAVIGPDDSYEDHVRDTLTSGAGLCREDALRFTVEQGPAAIDWLVELGVRFDRGKAGAYDLGREGGHSRRRVLHAADLTGQEIARALVAASEEHPRIDVLPHRLSIDLVTTKRLGTPGPVRIVGACVLDAESRRVQS